MGLSILRHFCHSCGGRNPEYTSGGMDSSIVYDYSVVGMTSGGFVIHSYLMTSLPTSLPQSTRSTISGTKFAIASRSVGSLFATVSTTAVTRTPLYVSVNATLPPSRKRYFFAISCGIRNARLFPHLATLVLMGQVYTSIYFQSTTDNVNP